MRLSLFLITLFFVASTQAQNVGVNVSNPETRLHIKGATDTTLLTIESPNTLAANKSVGLIFKNGIYYTGGIRSIGTSATTARLGIYTMAPGFGANEIKESMSITHEGNVGIGITAPAYKLAVNGSGYFFHDGNSGPDAGAVNGNSIVNSRFSPGVLGTGTSIGVSGNSNTAAGIGILGYNNNGNANLSYFAGAGVQGFSSAGHGVVGTTGKTASAGVYGSSAIQGAWGGQFTGTGGALALYSNGPLRLTGIGESAGKVLTSDANGNATWQTPAGGNTASPVAFSAHMAAGQLGGIVSGISYTLTDLVADYQLGNSFNATEGFFVAPADGVYQFTVRIEYYAPGSDPVYSTVGFMVNGNLAVGGEFNHITPGITYGFNQSLTYTKTMNLSAGSYVQVLYRLRSDNENYQFTLFGGDAPFASFFSGIKIL